MQIRPAQNHERETLAALGLAAWQRGIGPLVDAVVLARILAENPFLPFLTSRSADVLVAERDGRPLGFGACEHADNDISDIWVSPEHEGQGVGRALIAALEARARERGFAVMTIGAAAANERAHGLYRHLGYVETERLSKWDDVLGTRLDMIRLGKPL